MGRHQCGHSPGPHNGSQQIHDGATGFGVELAGRLVRDEQLGVVGQGPGHRDPLLLAAGELIRALRRVAAEADQLQQHLHPLLPLGRLHPGQAHGYADVLGRGQDRHQPEGLEHEPDHVSA